MGVSEQTPALFDSLHTILDGQLISYPLLHWGACHYLLLDLQTQIAVGAVALVDLALATG